MAIVVAICLVGLALMGFALVSRISYGRSGVPPVIRPAVSGVGRITVTPSGAFTNAAIPVFSGIARITAASTGMFTIPGIPFFSSAVSVNFAPTGLVSATSKFTGSSAITIAASSTLTAGSGAFTLPPYTVGSPTNIGTVTGDTGMLNAGASAHYIEGTLAGNTTGAFRICVAGDSAGSNWIALDGLNDSHYGSRKRVAGVEGTWYPWDYSDYPRTIVAGDVFRQIISNGEMWTTFNGTEISGSRRTASNLSAIGAPFGNYVRIEPLFGLTFTSVNYGPVATPLSIISSAYDRGLNRLTVFINYVSATSPTYEFSTDGGATWSGIPAYANPSTGVAELRLASADTGLSDLVSATLRQVGTAYTAPFSFIIPEKMRPGMNLAIEGRADLGQSLAWYSGENYSTGKIGAIDQYVLPGTGIQSSSDGAGTTLKRGPNGGFYTTNGAGVTNVRGRLEKVFNTDELGLWGFTLPAGTVMDFGNTGGVTSPTYNSVTGVGSFSVPDAVNNMVVEFNITVSTIPSGVECVPVIKKSGVTAQFNQATVDTLAAVGDIFRMLDASQANNANYPTRTPTTLPTRTWANRNRYYAWDVETQVAFCNALRATGNSKGDLWYITHHIDDNTMIDNATDYIIANLVGDAVYSFSNELCFNTIFQQHSDALLGGARLGFAVTGATPGTAVAETIYEGHQEGTVQAPTIQRGFWNGVTFTIDPYSGTHTKLLVAIPAGGKILIPYAGYRVFQTSGAAAIGTIFPNDGSGSFVELYNPSAVATAKFRWISSRMKNMIARVKARYVAAGKPAPKFMLDGFSQDESMTNTMLSWDNLYLDMGGQYASPGPYYGNGAYGSALGTFGEAVYTEWGPTTGKLALFDATTNVTLASRISAASTAYFSASGKTVTATVNGMKAWNAALRAYNISKGQTSGWIKQAAYEFNWHVQFADWPDKNASAYSAATDYNLGDFVMSGGNMYRAYANPPIATAPSNTSYWQVVATAAELVNGVPSDQLFTAIVLDSRHGTDILNHAQGLRSIHGGPMCFYQSFVQNISSGNYFGLMQNANDTGAGNYRRAAYKTVVDQVRAG